MIFEEKTQQTITYNFEDILGWIKTFAARQLNVSPEDIKEENITIPMEVENFQVIVKVIKTTSNQKEEVKQE